METAKLILPEKSIELPIIVGTEDEKGLDISRLRNETGYITLDPGYVNTGSCQSSITFIDGETGILRYRGYPIEQLADSGIRFTDVAHLLIWGELPEQAGRKAEYSAMLTDEAYIHEDMRHFFNGFPANAHPMAILTSMVASLSAFYPEDSCENSEMVADCTIVRLLAKVRTIAAFSYRKSLGLPVRYPNPNLNYVENFLFMMFGRHFSDYDIDPVIEKALNLILVLHADHEQNCSTSAVRVVGSSQADLYATVAAGIAALWGRLHGGANQQILEMLEIIINDGGNYKKYVEMAKDKNNDFRLYGFGHRVYKNYDPRARILRKVTAEVLDTLNISNPLLDVARELEQVALEDEYFIERKLYPNVDFYSGILLKAMGIPTNMFTVIFVLGRLPGWLAQYREMITEPKTKIARPRQIYIGEKERPFPAAL